MTTAPPATMHPVATALSTIRDEMSSTYLERRSMIDAMLIATLAKQHAFILGPPGTAKSEMVRDLVSRFTDATYFESLLSKTRPDAAILGPYNLPELRDKGDFHRKIAGFLPTANFAFLDEAGKMSPTLGHDLLSILNERLYHEVNGGRSAKDVPLYTAFTASNELIVEESDDAAALWDRLLVRITVDYIQESGNFATLLQAVAGSPATVNRTEISFAALAEAIDVEVPAIDIPLNSVECVLKLRDEMRSAEIVVSDRRWRQCMRLMQANAFLNGRTETNEDDVHILHYALWDVPSQITTVKRIALSLSNPIAEKCLGLMDDIEAISGEIRNRKGQAVETKATFGTEVMGKIKTLTAELSQIRQECISAGRSVNTVDEVADRLVAVRRSVYVDLMGMDPATIR